MHFGHREPKNPKIDPFYDVTGKISYNFELLSISSDLVTKKTSLHQI